MLPTESDFRSALYTYRKKWPDEGYFDQTGRFMETYRLLRQHYSAGRIIDIGGWPGDFSCTLASLGFSVLLLDRDLARSTKKIFDSQSNQWVLAQSNTLRDKCMRYNIETVECDIERERSPFSDDTFSFIVFTEIIEHLHTSPLFALRELRRILKPNGILLITTPNLLSLKNRLSFLTGRAQYDTLDMPYDALESEERIGHGGHFRVFSMVELVDMIQRVGFRVRDRGYLQISKFDVVTQWSFFALRIKLCNHIIRWIPQLGKHLYVIATQD
jgi:SAM-dependent methyltransferase